MGKTFNIKNVDNMNFSRHIEVKVFVLYLLVLCLGVFSIYIFLTGIKAKKEYNFNYTENNKIDYKVYLKENDFFESPYLEAGTKYISSLIDNISIDFNYEINSEDEMSGDDNYTIVAKIEATEKGKDIVIWDKEEVINEGTVSSFENTNHHEIIANTVIDYKKYNNIINEFRNAYGVSIDGTLIISLKVNSNISHEKSDEPIPVNNEASLRIPLIEQTVNIEMDSVGDVEKSNVITYTERNIWHYVLVVCGIILFAYYLYLSFCLLRLIYDIIINQNKYDNRLKKIFNNYDSLIVKVKDLPNIDNKSIMDVETFDELLDAKVNLNEPILYNEIEINHKSLFIVIKDDRVFRYIIDYTDFVK